MLVCAWQQSDSLQVGALQVVISKVEFEFVCVVLCLLLQLVLWVAAQLLGWS